MKTRMVLALPFLLALIVMADCSKEKGLPDLSLSEIGCQGGVLYFKVTNDGQGDIPKDWQSLASVAIDGVNQGDVALNRPTSRLNGGAEKAGGTSTYLTAYSVYNTIRVDIALDYNDAIRESHRDDDVRHSLYVAPCDLPDLVVEEIAVDENCFLTLKLKNMGPGLVPKKAWHYEFMDYCAVSIYLQDKAWACIPLVSLDPNHALEPPGGTLMFKSDVKIKEKTLVTAIVDSTANISESNEQNNKASSIPGCKK